MKASKNLTGLKTIDFQRFTSCSNWEELMHYWETHLTALVHQFLEGRAEVNPFNRSNTCRHCGLETLCRINELLQTNEEEETQ